MSTEDKSIAVPREGKVSRHRAKQVADTGLYTGGKIYRRTGQIENPLVAKVTGVRSGSREKMLTRIKKGLKFTAIAQLENALHASQKEIAQVLSIPLSTLNRRKKEGHLQTDESDRVVRLAHLTDAALALMQGDEKAAVAWLRTPLDILGGESPLEHAGTELGARDVEDLIGRLRHGVFS
ncbi:MAG: DUF2384 domain-containing protein [Candidatus Thiodiazotropha sp. (ex Epidulcina cf. delphinae)]|nr:DUF2384 domain-containing protein [Candidatus Thiodiazotropha sp. (ex Epidulcina cf. delphinae)]